MKSTELLSQDHKTILRGLDVLYEMAFLVEKGAAVDRDDVAALLRFMRTFADDYHQTREESALFPELLRTASGKEPSVRQMLFEHEQERSLIEALEDALHTRQNAEFVYFAERFIDLIRTHIHKEENILFDIVERSLTAEQDGKVASELNKFQIDPDYPADLRRLEWKYLRKAA